MEPELAALIEKLAEAGGGELNAATALRKLRLSLERILIRAEADAINVTEQANLRKTLREIMLEGEGGGGWWDGSSVVVAVDPASSVLLFPFSSCAYHSSGFILNGCQGREREKKKCVASSVCRLVKRLESARSRGRIEGGT